MLPVYSFLHIQSAPFAPAPPNGRALYFAIQMNQENTKSVIVNIMKHVEGCPLCSQTSPEKVTISICSDCHTNLHGQGALPVSQTGEFSMMPLSQAEKILASEAVESDPENPVCTWCDTPKNLVKRLITRGQHHICNECISLCVDMLSVEFGDTWRK